MGRNKTGKLAIIGFGYWGQKIYDQLSILVPKKDIIVVDKDAMIKNEVEKMGLNFYENLDSSPMQINRAFVVTPELTHFDISKKLLSNGVHVMSEKPLAVKYQDAQILVELAKKMNVLLMVDNTFVYDVAFLKVLKRIPKLGKIKKITSVRCSSKRVANSCDLVLDLMPHDISILGQVFGRLTDQFEVVNESAGSLELKLDFDKTQVNIKLVGNTKRKKRVWMIQGDTGSLVWRRESSKVDTISLTGVGIGNEKTQIEGKQNTLRKVIKAFLECSETMTQPKTAGFKVLKEVRLMEKILNKIN